MLVAFVQSALDICLEYDIARQSASIYTASQPVRNQGGGGQLEYIHRHTGTQRPEAVDIQEKPRRASRHKQIHIILVATDGAAKVIVQVLYIEKEPTIA